MSVWVLATQVMTTFDDAAGGEAASGGGGSLVPTLIMLAAIGAIMYFMIIRPQVRERKTHEALLGGLSKDDRVVMSDGLHGRVVSVADDTVVVEVGDRIRLTFDKSAVGRRLGASDDAKKGS